MKNIKINRSASLRKRILVLFFTFFIIVVQIFGAGITDASAASMSVKARSAMRAYSAFLAKNQSRFKSEEYNFKKNNSEKHTTASYFAVADLDGNGIQELIIIHPQAFKRVILRFYTYSGGKMVAFRNAHNRAAFIDINSQACGTCTDKGRD